MFDLFSFDPIDHNPFQEVGSQNSPLPPEKPPEMRLQDQGFSSSEPSWYTQSQFGSIDKYRELLQSGIHPDVAKAIVSRPQREEWETQEAPRPIGEPSTVPRGYQAPDAGARNLFGVEQQRMWAPKPWNSRPIDQINFLGPPANDQSPPEEGQNPLHYPGGMPPMEEEKRLGMALTPGMISPGGQMPPPPNSNMGMRSNIGPAFPMNIGTDKLGISAPTHSFVGNDIPRNELTVKTPRTGNLRIFISPETFNWKPETSEYLRDLADRQARAGNLEYGDMLNKVRMMGPKLAKQWLEDKTYGQNMVLKGYLEKVKEMEDQK